MSKARCKREVSARELTEWYAYWELNPFGPERADLAAGIIASTIANCHSRKNFEPSEFMWKRDAKHGAKKTDSDKLVVLNLMAASMHAAGMVTEVPANG